MFIGSSHSLPLEVQKNIYRAAGPDSKASIKLLSRAHKKLIEEDHFFKVYDLPLFLLKERVKIARDEKSKIPFSSKILSGSAKTLFLFDKKSGLEMAHEAINQAKGTIDASETIPKIAEDLSMIDLERMISEAKTLQKLPKNQTLASIVEEIAPKNPKKAFEIAKTLDKRIFKANALGYAAAGFSHIDPEMEREALSLALEEVDSIKNISPKISCLLCILRALTLTNPKLAFTVGLKALEAALSFDNISKDSSYRMIFELLSKIDADEMLKTANKKKLTNDSVHSQYAKAKVQSDIQKALEAINLIQDNYIKALAIAEILPIVAKKDPEKALLLAEEALSLAMNIKESGKRGTVLMTLAKTVACISTKKAFDAADKIEDIKRKSSAEEVIIPIIAKTDLETALKLVEAIKETHNRAAAYMDIAKNLAPTDGLKAYEIAFKGIECGKTIENPEIRDLFFEKSIAKFMNW